MRTALVPAFALLTSAALPAQEVAKGLFIDGWVDTVLTVVDTPRYVPFATPFSQQDAAIDFSAKASLKVGWQVTDRVKTLVNVWFNNGDANAAGFATAADNVYLKEAFLSVDAGHGLTWVMGKFANHLGWVAGEPTGLYRVNYGIITGTFYGANDPIGATLAWSDEGGNLTALVGLTNGYWRAKDGQNSASIDNGSIQPKNDLGIGIDLQANFGKDQASYAALEFTYDAHASSPVSVQRLVDPVTGTWATITPTTGAVWQIGFNSTVKPGGKAGALTLGGELVWQERREEDSNPYPDANYDRQDLGALLMANYAIEAGIPLSVTAMWQHVNPYVGGRGGSRYDTMISMMPGTVDEVWTSNAAAVHEFALALLTNPFGDSNFGMNLEISHKLVEGSTVQAVAPSPLVRQVTRDPRHGETVFALEAIAVIP